MKAAKAPLPSSLGPEEAERATPVGFGPTSLLPAYFACRTALVLRIYACSRPSGGAATLGLLSTSFVV